MNRRDTHNNHLQTAENGERYTGNGRKEGQKVQRRRDKGSEKNKIDRKEDRRGKTYRR